MKRRAAIGVAIAALTLALHAQGRPELIRLVGRTVSGTVVSVADGDTVRIRVDSLGRTIPVRLEGIDCPELSEAFGSDARNATRVMMFDTVVQVKATDVDRYDRLVGRITIDGKDSSVELLGAGLACHYTRYSSDRSLAAAELAAKTVGKGFWAAGASKPSCAKSADVRVPGAVAGPFHGNRQSRVYHTRACENFNCTRCTVVFESADDARKAGYRPAGDCAR